MHINPARSTRRNIRSASAAVKLRAARGLTLPEVLISMFILSIGLLGVASLLPVGQLQVQKGSIDERKAAVSDAAFAQIEANGWLRSGQWYTLGGKKFDFLEGASTASRLALVVESDRSGNSFTPTIPEGFHDFFHPIGNETCLLEFRSGEYRGLQRRVAGGDLDLVPGVDGVTLAPKAGDTFVLLRNQAFAIDPLFSGEQGTSDDLKWFARDMPRIHVRPVGWLGSDGATSALGSMDLQYAPVRQMCLDVAKAICVAHDDLTFEQPKDKETPYDATQTFLQNGTGGTAQNVQRQSDGDFSWLATFVPDALESDWASPESYTVSVAVFYKRMVKGTGTTNLRNPSAEALDHPNAYADVTLNGSALILDFQEKGYLKELKPGQWILVWGQNALGMTAYEWYRVRTVTTPYDDDDTKALVSIQGPDSLLNWSNPQAKVFQGLVGVYQKKMNVEQ